MRKHLIPIVLLCLMITGCTTDQPNKSAEKGYLQADCPLTKSDLLSPTVITCSATFHHALGKFNQIYGKSLNNASIGIALGMFKRAAYYCRKSPLIRRSALEMQAVLYYYQGDEKCSSKAYREMKFIQRPWKNHKEDSGVISKHLDMMKICSFDREGLNSIISGDFYSVFGTLHNARKHYKSALKSVCPNIRQQAKYKLSQSK